VLLAWGKRLRDIRKKFARQDPHRDREGQKKKKKTEDEEKREWSEGIEEVIGKICERSGGRL